MYNKLQAFEAIKARIDGDWTNPELLKMGALSNDALFDIAYIKNMTIDWYKNPESFDNAQIQSLLDNNEKYDILLFVQIPRSFFHRDLLSYMELRAKFQGRGIDHEFMFAAYHLKGAIAYFERWKDKTIVDQCRQLDNDLSAVQYIHVID